MEIQIKYKYLKHDIDQATFRLAGIRIEDQVLRDDAQSSEIDSDKSYYRRHIEFAVSVLKTLLGERLNKVTSPAANSDLDITKSAWTFDLKDDENFKPDSESLAELFHHFLLQQVIIHWAVTYAPDSVASIQAEADAVTDNLNNALYDLSLPIKHRRKPFCEHSEITCEIIEEDETA